MKRFWELIIVGLIALVVVCGTGLLYEYTDLGLSVLIKPEIELPQEPIKIIFVGDMMFDRGVANHIRKNGIDSLFLGVKDLLASADIVVGNHEGAETENKSVAKSGSSILRFTFDPSIADVLKRYNFSAVSLANNHATDFGVAGYNTTKNYLTNAGVIPFGSPKNSDNLTAALNVRGDTVCIIGYHDLYTYDESPVFKEIARVKSDCKHLVVFAHWGEEYKTESNERERELAHAFVDAGVDLVVGSHPHVIQEYEVYKNHAIFYSLGNFIFDQDFSYDTTHGLALQVEWNKIDMQLTSIPISINKGEASVSTSTQIVTFNLLKNEALYFGDKKVTLLHADTNIEQEKGLSGRISLPEDSAMLFTFKKPDFFGFWMKDMNFPIDIIWLDDNYKVVTIKNNVSPNTYPEIFKPSLPTMYVLEMNAGASADYGIKAGDKLDIR